MCWCWWCKAVHEQLTCNGGGVMLSTLHITLITRTNETRHLVRGEVPVAVDRWRPARDLECDDVTLRCQAMTRHQHLHSHPHV